MAGGPGNPLWVKGMASPNPGGVKKLKALAIAYRAKFESKVPDDPLGRTHAEFLADMAMGMAMNQDLDALREMGDRAYGKPTQEVEVTTPLDALSPEERDARLRELAAKMLSGSQPEKPAPPAPPTPERVN